MYHNAKELLALIGDSGKSIADIVIENEMEISEMSREAIMDELQRRYDIMYKACHDGLETAVTSISGLTGGTGKQMWDFIKSGKGIQDLTTQKGIAYALSCSEVNASMGLIVAAPTAGACGILPGTLICVAEKLWLPQQALVRSSPKTQPFPVRKAAARQNAVQQLPWLRQQSLSSAAVLRNSASRQLQLL